MSRKNFDYIVIEGSKFTIEWYYNKNYKSDVFEHYESLSASEQMDALVLFEIMAKEGKILNTTKFNSEGDQIYAFKPGQERFICFFCHGKKIIVTNAYRKKTQKMPPREKDKAKKRRKDYLDRVAKGEYYDE
ncbi:MAG: type II toxin-antitoxin system RelE/ParE family toxin [Candidatus Babeliales bacterium]|uniref:Type II toxin-antitoxin system RelE/ParE family toxin n=1 Tax=Candidatus Berkiella aquae TaxID=295108 RepID=A0A0Q9YNS0_9GAMM|nr:type II toxin-antitoxin system RelE/ParE family toxin [Candidatus Berkiella aquae]MCS5712851.1 type II toxin-antitoxin system RelE/ParE family toxin [Candidatus Berkiella aquae]